MKRIGIMMLTFLWMSSVVMAQDAARKPHKKIDMKQRVERMTERMAKDYGLNDAQKQELLQANGELMEKMAKFPKATRRPKMKKGGKKCCCCCCAHPKPFRNKPSMKKGERKELTQEQRAKQKANRDEKRKELKVIQDAYDAKLKNIFTKEQYETFTKNKDKHKMAKKENRG